MMMPPAAFSATTSNSTVGVVDRPKSITSAPSEARVWATSSEIIGPLILPSLPIIIFLLLPDIAHCPKADAYRTISSGESDSPGFPPIVPLMPEMLLISANFNEF